MAIVSDRSDRNDEQFMEVYRDAATFVYRDGSNKQILSQWLIDESGHTYWNRSCRIGDKGGPIWSSCSSWDKAHDIADLGLPGFGPISGMNTYAWIEMSAGYPRQYVAQTVFDERGENRMGRVCPILRQPLWEECTDWNKLAVVTEQLEVPGATSLRDDFYFQYTNADSEVVLVQSVLSIDGSLMWDRHCVSAQGNPLIPAWQCGFGTRFPLKEFGIRLGAMAGGAQYVYQDGDTQKLNQTMISVDGTKAYHRGCTVTPRGVDWSNCEPMTASTITQLRNTAAPF
jgi:hypothetical protein